MKLRPTLITKHAFDSRLLVFDIKKVLRVNNSNLKTFQEKHWMLKESTSLYPESFAFSNVMAGLLTYSLSRPSLSDEK
jgi:hypothetical protein